MITLLIKEMFVERFSSKGEEEKKRKYQLFYPTIEHNFE